MDDLAPAPHAFHAAIVRSQLAHARVTVDPAPALVLPGVVGVLTGDDVVAMSRPFPAGVDSPVPFYAATVRTARYVGEPLAVVVARNRYIAEDAAELVAVDYDPLHALLDPVAAAETRGVHPGPLLSLWRRGRGALARRPRRPRDLSLPELLVHARRVLRRRLPSGALYDSSDYEACLDDALRLARWDERRAEAEAARDEGRLVSSSRSPATSALPPTMLSSRCRRRRSG